MDIISLSAFAPENLISRNGFGSPVPRQPAHLQTEAKSGAGLNIGRNTRYKKKKNEMIGDNSATLSLSFTPRRRHAILFSHS